MGHPSPLICAPRPVVQPVQVPACKEFSRAYLHHLFKADEIQGLMLLTWHNLQHYQDLMAELRSAIDSGQLDDFTAGFAEEQARGDIPPL